MPAADNVLSWIFMKPNHTPVEPVSGDDRALCLKQWQTPPCRKLRTARWNMSFTPAIVKSSRLPIAASLILALLAGPVHAGDAAEDKISSLSEAEREFITIVRRLCAESSVVGFDLVELHPALDPTYKTTLNSAHIVKACLTGLAMNREGLTDRHYLSPTASEHALDDYYGDQQEYLEASKAEGESGDSDG